MSSISASAQKIQDVLLSLGSSSIVVEFTGSTRTAQEAADRIGCQLGQIVKSLIFKGRSSNHGILVLTSGANRVDEKKISSFTGEPIDRADPDFVRNVTGFAIGGVPPVGLISSLKTYTDEDLLQFPTIWAAAGAPNAVFELSPSDLVKFTHSQVVKVKPA